MTIVEAMAVKAAGVRAEEQTVPTFVTKTAFTATPRG